MLDDDAKWQGALTRNPAMDGRYFLAVKTTRIVCRPICPARPKRENVTFFDTLSRALAAGYRPCKRCKPLLASL